MRFHLCHAIPADHGGLLHGLNGLKDIIDAVGWGLAELGHEVSYAVNTAAPDATNILFGAQVLPMELLTKLPNDTIVYNLEQLRGGDPRHAKPEIRWCAEHFRIWDYSPQNLDVWRALGVDKVDVVPIFHAKVLERIPKAEVQDIDVLFYGSPAPKRMAVIDAICRTGLAFVYLCGIYGTARDAMIARAKVVLNVNYVDMARIFEVARVLYLLSNRKAVVALNEPGTAIEPDIERAVCFSTKATLLGDCVRLVGNAAEREALEEAGYAAIASRDSRPILARALASPVRAAS